MSVVIIKLLGGEEVIATRIADVYCKARSFNVQQDQSGQPRVGLVPFIMTAPDAQLRLNQALVLAEISAPADIEKSYLQATSGIQLL
jgi:hypothetical protein